MTDRPPADDAPRAQLPHEEPTGTPRLPIFLHHPGRMIAVSTIAGVLAGKAVRSIARTIR